MKIFVSLCECGGRIRVKFFRHKQKKIVSCDLFLIVTTVIFGLLFYHNFKQSLFPARDFILIPQSEICQCF